MGSTLSVPLKMLKDGILHPYMKAMPLLILIRHGQSIWNAANLFTGWENVELSEKGILEAKDAGNKLSDINLDLVFTSNLIRAQKTAEIILEENSKSENEMKSGNPFPFSPEISEFPAAAFRSSRRAASI